jgi:outer membrane protein OmpA-like peptidoglycan-associated protein
MSKIYIRIVFTLLPLALSGGNVLFAQSIKKDSALKPIACDCKDAIVINLNKPHNVYGPTVVTKGYGKIQEITVKDKLSKYYFEEEHNTAWYLLKIGFDGNLVFDIKPEQATDDYDFLLFPITDSAFCKKFRRRELIPVRSNISRNTDSAGQTGLSMYDSNQYAIRGPHAQYSQYVEVKKGEEYMLVLDNVYPGGKGHTISFSYMVDVVFSGTVTNDDNKPIKAQVSVEGDNNMVLKSVYTDPVTGKYSFHALLLAGEQYSLNAYNDSLFFSSKMVSVSGVKDEGEYQDITTVLPKLKGGKNYVIDNIHFYTDKAVLTPVSYATVKQLFNLMKMNSKMKIRIEGNVHDPGGIDRDFARTLSENRAKAVFNYLVRKGIDPSRMTTVGYAATRMKYPKAKNEYQRQMNRRVEISVLSVN